MLRPDASTNYEARDTSLNNNIRELYVKTEGTTVYWYHKQDATNQLNKGYPVYYFAIG